MRPPSALAVRQSADHLMPARTALPEVKAISVRVLNTCARVSRAGRNMVRWLLRLVCVVNPR